MRGSNSIGTLCGSRVCGVERCRWRRKGSGALGSAAEQCKRRKSTQQCETAQPGRVPERLLSLRDGLMGRSASGKAHWTVAFFLIFLCLLLLDNCSTHLSLPLFFITQKRARPYALLHLPGPFYIIFDHSSAHQHLRRVIPWLLPVLWPKSAIRHHKHGAGYSQSEI